MLPGPLLCLHPRICCAKQTFFLEGLSFKTSTRNSTSPDLLCCRTHNHHQTEQSPLPDRPIPSVVAWPVLVTVTRANESSACACGRAGGAGPLPTGGVRGARGAAPPPPPPPRGAAANHSRPLHPRDLMFQPRRAPFTHPTTSHFKRLSDSLGSTARARARLRPLCVQRFHQLGSTADRDLERLGLVSLATPSYQVRQRSHLHRLSHRGRGCRPGWEGPRGGEHLPRPLQQAGLAGV
jgi:hypothetical protein